MTKYEFVNLMPYVNTSKLQKSYGAGDQLTLLKHAFDFKWVITEMEGDYHGTWYAVFIHEQRWCIVNGYFGSCSGCDSLVNTDPIDWLEDYVKNVRAFESKSDLMTWLKTTDDYSYSSIKNRILKLLKKSNAQ